MTVVTVVLDDAAGLRHTAGSVLAQQDVAFDWVVVDGGSTDGTVQVIRSLSGCIAQWSSCPDGGVYDAMNKGVAAASGDYVLFMNAGDAFAGSDSLACLARVAALQRPAVVCGGSLFRYPSGVLLRRRARPVGRCIWHQAPCSHQAMLTRADLLRAWPFERRFQIAADYALVCRLFVQGERFVTIAVTVAVTPHGGRSLSHRNAWLMMREKRAIQCQILRAGSARTTLSLLRRLATVAGEAILSLRPDVWRLPARSAARRAAPP